MQVTNKDKVNHYVNNLELASFKNEKLTDLYNKVDKVKNEVSFIIFCIDNHDNERMSINELERYFIINK